MTADRAMAGAATMIPPPASARSTSIGAMLRDATARLAAAGLPTPRLDAECLLAHLLGRTRLRLHVDAALPLPPGVAAPVAGAVARRVRHEPLEYITGEVEFRGLGLRVGPGVFIPRPETEGLVDTALALGPAGPGTVVDLCTGSGAVACALAVTRPAWVVWAVERSPAAVACARDNIRRLSLEGRVRLLAGDLVAPLAGRDLEGRADLVVANPPYLARAILPTLPREVRDWEPALALDGGEDGTAVIRRILTAAAVLLRAGGVLVVEIGEEQGPVLRARLAEDPGYTETAIHRDFRGRERVLVVRRA